MIQRPGTGHTKEKQRFLLFVLFLSRYLWSYGTRLRSAGKLNESLFSPQTSMCAVVPAL